MSEDNDNSEHRRHISKLEQSDCCIAEVNLEEEDCDSVMVPVGPATPSLTASGAKGEKSATNKKPNVDLEKGSEQKMKG